MIGLPSWAQMKLNRAEVDTMGKLAVQLNQFEAGKQDRKRFEKKENSFKKSDEKLEQNDRKRTYKPCRFCAAIGKENMMHPERLCYNNPGGENYKGAKDQKKGAGPIRIASNTLLE